MKKLISISVIVLFVLAGCSDFDQRTQFNTTYTNRVSLDSNNTNLGGEQVVISDTLLTDFIGLVEDHSSSENKIESVRMVGISLEIDQATSISHANFDFLKNFKVYLKGKDMDEFLVGQSDTVPLGGKKYFEFQVAPKDDDFEELLKSNEFTCKIKFFTNKRLFGDSSVVVKISPTYRVDTKKLGI